MDIKKYYRSNLKKLVTEKEYATTDRAKPCPNNSNHPIIIWVTRIPSYGERFFNVCKICNAEEIQVLTDYHKEGMKAHKKAGTKGRKNLKLSQHRSYKSAKKRRREIQRKG